MLFMVVVSLTLYRGPSPEPYLEQSLRDASHFGSVLFLGAWIISR